MAKKNSKVAEVVVEELDAEAFVDEGVEREPNPLFESARKILLASIGGWALAWDEIEDFVDRLVERGEVAEQDARKLLREMAEKRRPAELDERMEEILNRMNVPSKADIEALGDKIAALTKKVEELKKTQA
ncbi:MAG: phasin family protein [Ardenticatenaceae bacterium]|nr:phasin family protein [Ardenticatenaceae bacterium]